jgi:hypothetical protein
MSHHSQKPGPNLRVGEKGRRLGAKRKVSKGADIRLDREGHSEGETSRTHTNPVSIITLWKENIFEAILSLQGGGGRIREEESVWRHLLLTTVVLTLVNWNRGNGRIISCVP